MIRELVLKNRSYRRFYQDKPVEAGLLKQLIDLARLSPSAANLQPLKYIISAEPERNSLIFPTLAWAGYLTDWPGPAEGERPAAYIIILGDKRIKRKIDCDHGIAAQSILLGAVENGLGGCIIASINREELRRVLNIPEDFDILLVLALGVPDEKIQLEIMDREANIKYWRDEQNVHHVPKRALDDIIIK